MEPDATAPAIDTAELSRKLRPLLEDKRSAIIPGAQLGPLINQVLGGDLTYRHFFASGETPRLRTFVERYLPADLVFPTDERRGSDFLFALPYTAAPEDFLAQQGRLWRSFVSVHPSAKLVYDNATASVLAIPQLVAVPEGCAVIPSVSLQEHRQTCADFCGLLRDTGRANGELEQILSGFSERFYQSWLRVLRDAKPLDREWGEFRQAKLLTLFAQRLHALRVPSERIEQLRQELARDYDAARASARQPASIALHAPSQGTSLTKDQREKRARELLHAAADQLTYEQLQSVQLPVGVMLDILANDKH